ncbi:MAG: hypothetical protein ACK417_11750 [Bacteroidia bacterium]
MEKFLEKTTILAEEVDFQGYQADELGRVFIYQNMIFRGIYPHKVADTRALFDSGLIQELVKQGLFPRTYITEHEMEGFGLIIGHERISPVIYPSGWSFDMLKDAALLILRINMIAGKYGYQTIDGHGYNILFKHGKPVFIDLGSFIQNTENPKGWIAYEVFLKSMYAPLRIMASGNLFMGRALLLLGTRLLPHYSYYQYISPLYRLVNPFWLENYLTTYHKLKAFTHYSEGEIQQRAPKKLKRLLLWLKKNKLNPFDRVNLKKWEKRILQLKPKMQGTQWGDYHEQFLNEDGSLKSTPRFDKIADLVRERNIPRVLEVGANQGLFSEILLDRAGVQEIIATDYDEKAVNKMYLRLRETQKAISPAVLDIVSTIWGNYGREVSLRYRREAVIALALTHHVTITQKVPFEKFIRDLADFTSSYLFIEYMPLGLYSGDESKTPPLPDWYTEENFVDAMSKYFDIEHREQLEINRILFIGKKKA